MKFLIRFVTTPALFVGFIIGVLVITKTIHFYFTASTKKLKCWFYFSLNTIANSKTSESEKAKYIQNIQSEILVLLVVAECIIIILTKNFY